MQIEVKSLLNQPLGSSEIYPIDIANLSIEDNKAKVTGEATLTNLGDFILAKITGQATLTQPCSRCLKEVPLTTLFNFAREFRAEIPGQARNDEEEAYPIMDGKIDLTPLLTEEIIVNMPMKILCQEDCLGLCPQCGANLNDNPCKCDKVNDEISNKINF